MVKLEETQDKFDRHIENSSGSEDLLKIEIESLRKNVGILEEKLLNEQNSHNVEMKELSDNVNEKLKSLRTAQRKALDELENSKKEQNKALN